MATYNYLNISVFDNIVDANIFLKRVGRGNADIICISEQPGMKLKIYIKHVVEEKI